MITMFKFLVEGIALTLVGCIGISGNLVCIIYFSIKEGKSNFHQLMQCLAGFDLMYVILSILMFGVPSLIDGLSDTEQFKRLFTNLLPFAQIGLTGSIYMTVAIAIERYTTVCHPFFKLYHSWSARMYILPIIIFSVMLNVPKFFELRVANLSVEVPAHNTTLWQPQNLSSYMSCDQLIQPPSWCDSLVPCGPEYDYNTDPEKLVCINSTIVDQNNISIAMCCEKTKVQLDPEDPLPDIHVPPPDIHALKEPSADRALAELSKSDAEGVQIRSQTQELHLKSQDELIETSGRLLLAAETQNESEEESTNTKDTVVRNETAQIVPTDLRIDPLYIKIYLVYLNMGIHCIFPLVSLVILNVAVYRKMREISRLCGGDETRNLLHKQEIRLSQVSLLIVLVFITCHSVRWIPNIFELAEEWPPWLSYFSEISHLCMTFNSSVNFYIYEMKHGGCWKLLKNFRRTLPKTDEETVHFNIHTTYENQSLEGSQEKMSVTFKESKI